MECAAWTMRGLPSPVHKPGHSVMFLLVAPLLFIGFFSPANSETVDSKRQKPNEHLISLRDYDFVGEDQRLSTLLAERMAVLQAPLNLSDLGAGGPAPEPAGPRPRVPGPFQPKPDYLHSNVRLPQIVNVSMDYAEYFNASDASLPDPAPGLGGPPAPGYVRAAASGTGWTPTPGPGRGFRRHAWGSSIEPPKHSGAERQIKILEIMKQSIYAAQRRMLELDSVVEMYERDPRFRIAFIYNRLSEWLHTMRTVLRSMFMKRDYKRRVKVIIWYYEHMLRLNIDITYSVETLVNLHVAYMAAIGSLLPMAERLGLRNIIKQRKKLQKLKLKFKSRRG